MRNISICFDAACISENKMYFFTKYANMLCELDILENKIKILGNIPGYHFLAERLCGDLIKYNEELILIPSCAEDIWIFNIELSSWKKISLSLPKINYKFVDSVVYGKKLYMIGYFYPKIVCLDLITKKKEEIGTSYTSNNGVYFGFNNLLIDDILLVVCCSEAMVLKINLSEYREEKIYFNDIKNGFIGIAWDGEKFWLASYISGGLLIWDGKKTKRELFEDTKLNYPLGVVSDTKKIIYVSCYEEKRIIIEDEHMEFLEEQVAYSYLRNKNGYLISQKLNGNLELFNLENNQKKNIELLMNISTNLIIDDMHTIEKRILNESEIITLRILLSGCDSKKFNKIVEQKNNIGMKIYESLK